MRKLNIFVGLMIIVSLLCALTGCDNSKREIKNLMNEFEHACNTLDFNEVLNCINPKTAEKIKFAAGFIGAFTETDTDKMFQGLADILSSDDIGGADFFSSIKIEVKDIEREDNSAVVATLLTYHLDQDVTREATFNCIYYAEKWYISNFSMDWQ